MFMMMMTTTTMMMRMMMMIIIIKSHSGPLLVHLCLFTRWLPQISEMSQGLTKSHFQGTGPP